METPRPRRSFDAPEAPLTLAVVGFTLFSVGGLISLLIVGLLWSWLWPAARAPRRFFVAIVLIYALASYYPFSLALAGLIEAGFQPLTRDQVPPGSSVVVLLGSGSLTGEDWAGRKISLLDPIGTERTLEAARVFHLIDADWVISSGGGPDPAGRGTEPSGLAMKTWLARFGVPADRVLVEDQSHNTREEALMVAGMLPALHADHVILVTSQLHMRRSLRVFQAAGIPAVPAVAREGRNRGWLVRFLPSNSGLDLTSQVAHELVGYVYYRFRGYF